jgi:hypothetical protein
MVAPRADPTVDEAGQRRREAVADALRDNGQGLAAGGPDLGRPEAPAGQRVGEPGLDLVAMEPFPLALPDLREVRVRPKRRVGRMGVRDGGRGLRGSTKRGVDDLAWRFRWDRQGGGAPKVR